LIIVFQNIAQAGKNFNSFLKFPKQSTQLCTSQIGQIKCKKNFAASRPWQGQLAARGNEKGSD
jgi:hypothetical protein